MSTLVKEFKDFINRGNLVELAVAFVLGLAFAGMVTSLVDNILTPLIAAVFGEQDFRTLHFTLNESRINYGAFLNAVISFVLIAFVLFLVIKAYNRFKREQGEDPAGPSEVELLTEIRDALNRR